MVAVMIVQSAYSASSLCLSGTLSLSVSLSLSPLSVLLLCVCMYADAPPHHVHSTSSCYQAQRLTFSIFSLIGFLFIDLLYIAVMINYSCQCELLKAYIVNVKVKTHHKSYLLGDSVKVTLNLVFHPLLLCTSAMNHLCICTKL